MKRMLSIVLLASCAQICAMYGPVTRTSRLMPMVISRGMKSCPSKDTSWQRFVHDEFDHLEFYHTCEVDPNCLDTCSDQWPSQEELIEEPSLTLDDAERWAEVLAHSAGCLNKRLEVLKARKDISFGSSVFESERGPMLWKDIKNGKVKDIDGMKRLHNIIRKVTLAQNNLQLTAKKLEELAPKNNKRD